MSMFEDEVAPIAPRSGADWEQHRLHRSPQSGPPGDEIGMLAVSSFLLARTAEVVVAVRGITAYSDGLHLAVVVIFADHARSEDLAESVARESEGATVRAALVSLPAEQKRTVEMTYFAGLTISEVADRMSVPVGTVKSRLRLALQHLRRRLAEA